jgi:hypothetical protein
MTTRLTIRLGNPPCTSRISSKLKHHHRVSLTARDRCTNANLRWDVPVLLAHVSLARSLFNHISPQSTPSVQTINCWYINGFYSSPKGLSIAS